MKNFKLAPGYVLVKPIVVEPKKTFGKSDIINPNITAKNATFHQVEEIYDEHPFQATVLAVSELTGGNLVGPKEWLNDGDLVLLTREVSKNEAVIIPGQGVCAMIRPSDIYGVLIKEETNDTHDNN